MELSIVQKIAIWALPLIFAITLHEVAHGYVASLFGDQTARLSGRLSLNPIRHIDLIGTILVPLIMLVMTNFIFGWAKPVPVDPRNLNNPRRDMALVALAGPVANLIMAIFWAVIAKLGLVVGQLQNPWLGKPLVLMGLAGIVINIILAVLNLLPLPPLDGAKLFASILPRRAAYYYSQIEPYGFIILILLLASGALTMILDPFLQVFVRLIFQVFGL